MKSKNQYEELGIDPDKQSVREIFEKIIDNEYKGAFVNIVTDPFCANRVVVQHQDGDGSKLLQRLLHYHETGDPTVFRGMVDDALSMNTGDIAACGFVFLPWLVTDVLNVNFPKELKNIIMKEVAIRLAELKKLYADHGIRIILLGGETADLPDQVRSGVFDIAITAYADKKDLIVGNTQEGDVIYGIPSNGQAAWEDEPNSGMMSNGLTGSRSCLMSAEYNIKYPALKRDGNFFKGSWLYNDPLVLEGSSDRTIFKTTVGDALISPTRQWALVIREIMNSLKEIKALPMLHGISMNTGGGATKIKNVGPGGILYVKNMMPEVPRLFQLIQSDSREDWGNMYKNFNCGIGLDIVGENNPVFQNALKKAVNKCNLPLHRLGHCERFSETEKHNAVEITSSYGEWKY